MDDVQAAIADAMRTKAVARLSALRMLKAALMNREVEKGRALDDTEATYEAGGRRLGRQAAQGFYRAVHQGRPPGPRRQGSRGDCRPRILPASRGGRGRCRA